MFNFRIISVCLGHLGVSRGGVGVGKRRPWMPLTSNLFRSGNPNCIFLGGGDGACRIVVYVGHILLFSVLPAQFGMAWFFYGGGGSRTSLTLNSDLVCFLLGELVGFLPSSPYPHQEVAVSFLLPCKELCGTFHTSYSGMGLVCVCGTRMCSATALWTALE